MILKVKQLVEFRNASSSIKQNGILPVLAYLKFHDGTITKSNMESFVNMKADFQGSLLIDENILMNFLNFTKADEITLTVKENSVVITDGTKARVTSPTEAVENYPATKETDQQEIPLSKEVMRALRIASNFTVDDQTMPFKEFVFIGNNLVAVSNGFTSYTEKLETGERKIVVGQHAASTVSKFEEARFKENEAYQFFFTGAFDYGFAKKEVGFLDMTPFANMPAGPEVEVNKQELISFCEMCISSCPGRSVVASIEDGNMRMIDSAFGIDIDIPMIAPMENFSFNPAMMVKMLKSIPDDKMRWVSSGNKYFLTGASGFVSLIMKIFK